MIFNMTGGGSGSGATLVVSCPANVTVTVSKDDKSYTKNSGNLGSATFKGLATGEWTVTIEGNEQTATKNITITADYAITMAFFAAYISVTYPSGSTCTATDGVTTLAAPDTSGTWVCVVPNAGDWVFSLSSGYKSTVSITQGGQTETLNQWYIYNNGAEYFDVVPFNPVSDASVNYIDVTKNADYINFLNSTGEARGSGVYAIADLTGFTKLCVEITATGNYLNNGGFYIAPSASEMLWSQEVAKKSFSGSSNKKTYELDVSGFSGEYGCCFGVWSNNYDVKIYRMWCE